MKKREHFFERHRNLSIPQPELERKWKLKEREDLNDLYLWEFQLANQQAQAAAIAAGGGGFLLTGYVLSGYVLPGYVE